MWVITDQLTVSCSSDTKEFGAELHFRHCLLFCFTRPLVPDLCKRHQCSEPIAVSGVMSWLHPLQCFLSNTLLDDTRWGRSATVSCQKRALLLCCTWLECDVMLGERTSAGSHISSNIPACFSAQQPRRPVWDGLTWIFTLAVKPGP